MPSHQSRPQEAIQRAISQIIRRDADASKIDEPLIHAARAQKQCGIFGDPLPKRQMDHQKVAVDYATLLATIVAKIPTMLISEADTDAAGFVVALYGIPVVDHPLPPSDLFVGSAWRTAGKQILNGHFGQCADYEAPHGGQDFLVCVVASAARAVGFMMRTLDDWPTLRLSPTIASSDPQTSFEWLTHQ